MSTFWKWTRTWFLSLGLVLVAAHAEKDAAKGVVFGGSFEGGYSYDWTGGSRYDSNWQVDYLNLNMTANVSENTKVVLNNGFAFTSKSGSAAGFGLGQRNYWNRTVTVGLGTNGIVLGNTAAYIDHKCMDGLHTWVGNFAVPFGMESMVDRFDVPTYYISGAYTAIGRYWGYQDLGVKFALTDIIPGTLEVALQEGDNVRQFGPLLALRYQYDMKSGDMAFSPTVSAVFNTWRGGPKDMGFTVGTGMKSGAFLLNAEFLYGSQAIDPTLDPKNKVLSVYAEPGFDLGFATLTSKLEWGSFDNGAGSNSDFNVGAAISHTYAGGYRVRLAYQHQGLSGNGSIGGNHLNDIRLFVGTKF